MVLWGHDERASVDSFWIVLPRVLISWGKQLMIVAPWVCFSPWAYLCVRTIVLFLIIHVLLRYIPRQMTKYIRKVHAQVVMMLALTGVSFSIQGKCSIHRGVKRKGTVSPQPVRLLLFYAPPV